MRRLIWQFLTLVLAATLVGFGLTIYWTTTVIDRDLPDYPKEHPVPAPVIHTADQELVYENATKPKIDKNWATIREKFEAEYKYALVRRWTGEAYNLHNASISDPSNGEAYYMIKEHFKFKIQGFFIEYRAFDGETGSRTLLMERDFAWHGLLIEPDPTEYQRLLLKNRKAWTSNTCLAVKNGTHSMKLLRNSMFDGDEFVKAPAWLKIRTIPCYTLEHLILSGFGTQLENSTIDFFYLDAAGFELQVLRMIPIKKFYLKVISVKVYDGSIGRDGVQSYLQSHGYRNALEIRSVKRADIAQIIYVRLNSTDLDYVGEGSP